MNLNVLPLNTQKKKVRTDCHEKQILEYKRALGLSDQIDNVLIARKSPNKMMDLIMYNYARTVFAERFILSFENAGIVMLGLDFRQNFNGKNQLINRELIQSIHLKEGNMVVEMTVELKDRSITFYVDQFIDEAPFQYYNSKNFNLFEGKYEGQ